MRVKCWELLKIEPSLLGSLLNPQRNHKINVHSTAALLATHTSNSFTLKALQSCMPSPQSMCPWYITNFVVSPMTSPYKLVGHIHTYTFVGSNPTLCRLCNPFACSKNQQLYAHGCQECLNAKSTSKHMGSVHSKQNIQTELNAAVPLFCNCHATLCSGHWPYN